MVALRCETGGILGAENYIACLKEWDDMLDKLYARMYASSEIDAFIEYRNFFLSSDMSPAAACVLQ